MHLLVVVDMTFLNLLNDIEANEKLTQTLRQMTQQVKLNEEVTILLSPQIDHFHSKTSNAGSTIHFASKEDRVTTACASHTTLVRKEQTLPNLA